MPAIIEIPMRRTDSRGASAPTRANVHAAVSRAAAEADHHANTKPYSIWPLSVSPDGSEALLRIGWLEETLPFPLLSQTAWRFGGIHAEALGPRITDYPWADLLRATPADRVDWDFVSPTTFERSGVNYPLPDPRLIIDSLVRRWNAYCPLIPIAAEQALALARAVEVDHVRIRDQVLEPPHARRRGFIGQVGWHLVPQASGEAAPMLAALAAFARCAGVGYLTAQGYGACWTSSAATARTGGSPAEAERIGS